MKNLITLLLVIFFFQLSFAQKDGDYKKYHDNGQLKVIGQYKNKKRIGVWKDYYDNGQVSSIYSYNNRGVKSLIGRRYYKNGNIESFTSYIGDNKLIVRGYYDKGATKGSLSHEWVLKKGSKDDDFYKDGCHKEFYPNGTLKIESNYVKGNLNGLWTRFYASGKKEWEVAYYNDYKQGVYKQYYENGKLKLEGTNYRDLKEGEEKRYYKNGQLKWVGNYLNDDLDKKWSQFNDSGEQIKEVKYKNGKVKGDEKDIVLGPTNIPSHLGFDFLVLEQPPVYPGCNKRLGSIAQKKCMSNKVSLFINKRFNTRKVLGLGLEGRQRINTFFKIDKTGNVIGVMARASHVKLEQEAIRVIKLLPNVKPGMIQGKPVITPCSLPIILEVPKKKKKNPFEKPF